MIEWMKKLTIFLLTGNLKKKIANNLQSNLFKLSLCQKELLITKERRIHTFHWKYLTRAKNIAN